MVTAYSSHSLPLVQIGRRLPPLGEVEMRPSKGGPSRKDWRGRTRGRGRGTWTVWLSMIMEGCLVTLTCIPLGMKGLIDNGAKHKVLMHLLTVKPTRVNMTLSKKNC